MSAFKTTSNGGHGEQEVEFARVSYKGFFNKEARTEMGCDQSLKPFVDSTFCVTAQKEKIFCADSIEKFREGNVEIFRKAFGDSHYFVKAFSKDDEFTKVADGKIVTRICRDQV